MRQLMAATLAAFALVLAPALPAQINGVAPSVTSLGFGGHFNPAPGVPASVTSLGPRGLVANGLFFIQRPSCFNSGFRVQRDRDRVRDSIGHRVNRYSSDKELRLTVREQRRVWIDSILPSTTTAVGRLFSTAALEALPTTRSIVIASAYRGSSGQQ